MATLTLKGRKEFFRTLMQYHAVHHGFNSREVAVAAEFLYYRNRFLNSPITEEIIEEEDGEPVIVQKELTMMEQLKHRRTLQWITTNLDMSFVIFRKHVKGLVDKGFFHEGQINSKFIPLDDFSAVFTIKMEDES